MTHKRLAELLTACPELTLSEIERLKGYQPKPSKTWMCVQMALAQWFAE